MLKEDPSYASPIATLFYEYYESTTELKEKLNTDKELIQCVVAKDIEDAVPFGKRKLLP